jgi:hypothetical protein
MYIGNGSYNGLTWGPGTNFQIIGVKGIDDLPPVSASDQSKSQQDGSFIGQDEFDERTILLDFYIKAVSNTDLLVQKALFNAAFNRSFITDLPLLWADSTKLINCRCRGRTHDADAAWLATWGKAHVMLVAADPLIYDNVLTTTVLNIPAATGGLSWPLSWPLSWGSAVSGSSNFVNAGNATSYPVITFTGPLTNPSIIKNSPAPAQSLTFNISLASGDVLVVDIANRLITLNGTANRYNALVSSQWFGFDPGTTQLSFGASAGSGTASVAWRNAYS